MAKGAMYREMDSSKKKDLLAALRASCSLAQLCLCPQWYRTETRASLQSDVFFNILNGLSAYSQLRNIHGDILHVEKTT